MESFFFQANRRVHWSHSGKFWKSLCNCWNISSKVIFWSCLKLCLKNNFFSKINRNSNKQKIWCEMLNVWPYLIKDNFNIKEKEKKSSTQFGGIRCEWIDAFRTITCLYKRCWRWLKRIKGVGFFNLRSKKGSYLKTYIFEN